MIHDISISTAYDIIHIDDDVKLYTLNIFPGQISFGNLFLIG